MYAFDYQRPSALAEAAKLFGDGEDASYIAGGQTLIPTLKQRLRRPSVVIDLGAIPEMQGITVSADTVTIGAMTCHADVAASADVRRAIPALAALAARANNADLVARFSAAATGAAPALGAAAARLGESLGGLLPRGGGG